MTGEVLDFLEERVQPGRAAAIRAHLHGCETCAALYELAAKLHADVREAGARHLRPERLVELADGGAEGGSGEEREHLAACALCRAQLAQLVAMPLPAALAVGAHATAREPGGDAQPLTAPPDRGFPGALRDAVRSLLDRLARAPAWGKAGALAAAAAALVIVAVTLQAPPPQPPVTGLARIAPLEVQWTRGQAALPAAYTEGLAAYAAGDYAAAEEALVRAAELPETPGDALLFAGSAALLRGRLAAAAVSLRRAAAAAQDPFSQDEARWQLANALLAGGAVEEARAVLARVAAAGLGRAAAAAGLLQALDAAR